MAETYLLLRQYIRVDIYIYICIAGNEVREGRRLLIVHSLLKRHEGVFFFFPTNGIQLWRHAWAAATPAPAYVIYSSCWWPAKTFFEVQIAASPASMKASFSSACTSSPLHSTRAPFAIRQIVTDRDCRKCCCLYSWWLWRKTGGLPFLAQGKFKELM